jgi:hypothetical protein
VRMGGCLLDSNLVKNAVSLARISFSIGTKSFQGVET